MLSSGSVRRALHRGHARARGARRVFFVVLTSSAFALPGLVEIACSTDNGDSSHGPDIGKLPRRDANVPDGKVLLEDGAIVDDPDAGTSRSMVAVLAGDDSSLYGAVQEPGGAWQTTPLAGGAAKSQPALVAFGAGFLGVTRGEGDALQSTRFGDSWSDPTSFGAASVHGPPSLAVAGTKAHVVYSAGDGKFFTHGIHDGSNWNDATMQVGPPPSFGTISGGLATSGTELVFGENGGDSNLYVRSFNGTWQASKQIAGVTVLDEKQATPELASVGTTSDLLLVFVLKATYQLAWATRNASSKEWGAGTPIAVGVVAEEKFSLARLGSSTVLLAFRGQQEPDGSHNGYYTKGTISGDTVTWSATAAIGGGGKVLVDSTPAVARGIDGDDAIVAYASGGTVNVMRLRGSSWSSPETLPSVSGSYVAIATK